jgi:hypothetical protein
MRIDGAGRKDDGVLFHCFRAQLDFAARQQSRRSVIDWTPMFRSRAITPPAS